MAGQQQQGQGDNSMSLLWIIGAIFVAALVIWFLFKPQLVAGFFAIKSYEIDFISLFTTGLQGLKKALLIMDPASVTFNQVAIVANSVGQYVKYPVIIILIGLASILYFTSSKTAFCKTYSMKRLRDQEVENWPQITPILELDLVNQDIDKGEWALAQTPMGFAKKHRLLKIEDKPLMEKQLNRCRDKSVTVIRPKSNQVFVQQLGAPFSGVEKMKIQYRALFAIFAAKANADRDAANNLLLQIATSSATGHLDFSGTDELIKKHINSDLVQRVISKHAFELTVMATMLGVARMDGVLASAEFLWLKPTDRPLWYMLNTTGRRVAPVEISGAYAHWLAEKAIGRKLTVPMIEEATNALELAVAEILYKDNSE